MPIYRVTDTITQQAESEIYLQPEQMLSCSIVQCLVVPPCIETSAILDGVHRLEAEQLVERLAKFGIEHSVYDRVYEAVHVSQPRSHDEGCDARLAGDRQLRAKCIHYVAGEERQPTDQEDT